MKYIISLIFVSWISYSILADENVTNQREYEERRYNRTGGRILKPGSKTGVVKIINAQGAVTNSELAPTIAKLQKLLNINIKLEMGKTVGCDSALSAKNALNANAVVFIVDDEKLPVSLVAVEERWGIVNVRKLEQGNDKVQRFSRTRNEMVRVFAIVCGSYSSQFPGNVLSIGDAVSDLDLTSADLPIDILNTIMPSLKKIGVTPAVHCTYLRACREGWAPAPTNDIQKAIWDKVHAAPKNPMKIEFDPKKGR